MKCTAENHIASEVRFDSIRLAHVNCSQYSIYTVQYLCGSDRVRVREKEKSRPVAPILSLCGHHLRPQLLIIYFNPPQYSRKK